MADPCVLTRSEEMKRGVRVGHENQGTAYRNGGVMCRNQEEHVWRHGPQIQILYLQEMWMLICLALWLSSFIQHFADSMQANISQED